MSKIIRANIKAIDYGKLALPDLDDVCDHFEGFMVDAARASSRPSPKFLEAACLEAFDKLGPGEAKLFGQRLGAAFAHCRAKYGHCTSGAKTRASVRHIGAMLTKTKGKTNTKR
jgi:hypothetical protein